MMTDVSTPILECVPNFSEGRDLKKIEAIAQSIRDVAGVELLHIDQSPAANRTVMTFAGAPKLVAEAAFQAMKTAGNIIDMRIQEGVHPRIGSTDVCPFIPISNCTMHDADTIAKDVGRRVGEELLIPVYLYEQSASQLHRTALPNIRKGQYEGYKEKIKLPDWQPDYGPAIFNPAMGCTVIGARKILVAFNISLLSRDISLAESIARRLRTSGYTNTDGTKVKGKFSELRSIGWYMADYEQAQVSFNLLDYNITSPLQVYQACKALATEEGVELAGSEVIGLIPEACLLEAGSIADGVEKMKLDVLKPFDPQEKVLEYVLHNHGMPVGSIRAANFNPHR